VFTTTLSGLNEVPAISSSVTGFVTADLAGSNLAVNVSFTGLSSPATALFLRCCVAAGSNGDIALRLADFQFVTSDTFHPTFDLTQFSIYNPTFLTDGGSQSIFLASLSAGLVYINVSGTINPAPISASTPGLFHFNEALQPLFVCRARRVTSHAKTVTVRILHIHFPRSPRHIRG
jgi:hypothetical protein